MKSILNGIRHFAIVLLALFGLTFFITVRGQFSSAATPEESLSASLPDQPYAEKALSQRNDPKTSANLDEAYGKLPLSFEANQGQSAPQVKFLPRYSGSTLFLTASESVLV